MSTSNNNNETNNNGTPRVISQGINRLGNEWSVIDYGSAGTGYRYNNNDGTTYIKYGDGSATFDTGRGYQHHYAPPAPAPADQTDPTSGN